MSTNLTQRSWANWLGDHGNPDYLHASPTNLDELRQVVQHAVDNDLQIKPLGSGHSHSAASRPTDIGVGLNRLETDPKTSRHRILDDLGILKANPPGVASNETLVRVSAGVRIKELNRSLLDGMGLALPNMGSFDGQSISGAINTGTHGTGIGISTLADMVASCEIVTVLRECNAPVVKHIRIEPTNGITDPMKFNLHYADKGAFHMLIQDDRIFYSAVLSYGTMGVAYAYTLKAVDAFWLSNDLRMEKWSDFSGSLMTSPFSVPNVGTVPQEVNNTRHLQFILVSPKVQSQDDFTTSDPKVQIKSLDVVPVQSEPSNWSGTWPPERVEEPTPPPIPNFSVHPSTQNGAVGTAVTNRLTNETNTWGTPAFEGNFSESASFVALRRLRDPDPAAFGPLPAGPTLATSLEMAVPVGAGVFAINDVLDFMAADSNFRFIVPIGVRYCAPSKHYMSQCYGQGCCLIEVPITMEFQTASMSLATLNNLVKPKLAELEQRICYDSNYKGLPHLGKQHAMTRARAATFIPEWFTWLEVYATFNSFGIFDNRFTTELGISNIQSTATLDCDNFTAIVNPEFADEWIDFKKASKGPVDPNALKGK